VSLLFADVWTEDSASVDVNRRMEDFARSIP